LQSDTAAGPGPLGARRLRTDLDVWGGWAGAPPYFTN